MSISYAVPPFRDDANFSARRYRKLPPQAYEDDPLAATERQAQQRQH